MRALTPSGAAVVAMPKRTRFANTRSGFDYLIVGAGFAGSVLAERLAAGLGQAGPADRPPPAYRAATPMTTTTTPAC